MGRVTSLMDRLRVRHLPVIENDRVIGINLDANVMVGARSTSIGRWKSHARTQARNDELMGAMPI